MGHPRAAGSPGRRQRLRKGERLARAAPEGEEEARLPGHPLPHQEPARTIIVLLTDIHCNCIDNRLFMIDWVLEKLKLILNFINVDGAIGMRRRRRCLLNRYLDLWRQKLLRRFEALTPTTIERDTPLGFPTIKSIVRPSDVVFMAELSREA